ncbi:MAG: hypothetical protein KF755_03970 [Burkholderiaceae bacterium]|jgi:hypothetical protein|nr:hypothetical protein [Burkholderiaceae bacterium]
MSEDNSTAVSAAAISVINTLQPLSVDERAQVLHAAAALYSIQLASARQSHVHQSALQQAPSSAQARPESQKPVSVGEFVREKSPATNAQRIACFAYYRERFEHHEHFSRSDLSGYFAAARLPKPGNFDRDYNNAVKENWIHDSGAESYLTQTGEAAVSAGFDGKAKPRGASTRKKKAGSKRND